MNRLLVLLDNLFGTRVSTIVSSLERVEARLSAACTRSNVQVRVLQNMLDDAKTEANRAHLVYGKIASLLR